LRALECYPERGWGLRTGGEWRRQRYGAYCRNRAHDLTSDGFQLPPKNRGVGNVCDADVSHLCCIIPPNLSTIYILATLSSQTYFFLSVLYSWSFLTINKNDPTLSVLVRISHSLCLFIYLYINQNLTREDLDVV